MDCKICNPKTEDENVCENCMEINEGFRRHLQEITGYKLDHGWELNLNDFGDHVGWFLYGCYFGAKEPFAVDSNQVIRIDKPENTYRTDEELETEQKVTALQEEVAKAKNNLKISEEHSDAIVDGFDKLQEEADKLKQLIWDAEPVLLRAISSRDKYKSALEGVREIYTGMDGFIPKTAREAYQKQILEQIWDVVKEALSTEPSK